MPKARNIGGNFNPFIVNESIKTKKLARIEMDQWVKVAQNKQNLLILFIKKR